MPCIPYLPYIPNIHKHTILSKHAIPDRPYIPYPTYINIPYHTPTTPQGGGGWDPSHGGGGGVAGPGAYIYNIICTCVCVSVHVHLFKNPHIICSNHCKECLSTWKWFVRSCLYNSSLSHRAPFRWKWNQTLGFMGTVQQLSSCLVLWLLGCFHILLYFGE